LAKTKERVQFELMAIYRSDMEKISNEMQSVENYSELACLYDNSAKLIRQLENDLKDLEDGN